MNYTLAKQLKDAGFPLSNNPCKRCAPYFEGELGCPTLSELIEACGDNFGQLWAETNTVTDKIQCWFASPQEIDDMELGTTPEEAVANLWLKLQEK